MNDVIYKYGLQIQDRNIIKLPVDAEILTVQIQEGVPYLWVLLNTNYRTVERIFWIHGTGQYILFPQHYIGTFQTPPFVWHLFEEK